MSHHDHLCDLYLRLSLDKEGKTAIERQEADCRTWAACNGLEVRTIHIDRGRSGFKHVARVGFDAAVSAVATGVVGTLLVWKVDRLSRQGIGQVGAVLNAVEKIGGRLVFVQDGLDTSQPQARHVLALLSEVARTESANIGVRVASAKSHLRALGRWIGGAAPYRLRIGESGRLEHDPETAGLAREIAERALAGEAVVSIARDLNARNIPAPRGGLWGTNTLTQLVRTPSFAGLLPETLKRDGRYTGKVVPWRHPGTAETVEIGEGIVTPAEQLQISRLLKSRAMITRDGVQRGCRAQTLHLLTGFLRCSSCGGRMSAAGLSYVCMSRRLGRPCEGYANAMITAIDRAVAYAFTARLAALELGDPLLDTVAERWVARYDPDVIQSRTTIATALDDAETRLADLEDARYLRNEFDGPEALKRFTRLHDQLSSRVAGLRTNLAGHPLPEADISHLLDPEHAREMWALADVAERRALLALAVDSIEVTPGRGRGFRFDPAERLRFTWADQSSS